jgi:O-antigen polymerase
MSVAPLLRDPRPTTLAPPAAVASAAWTRGLTIVGALVYAAALNRVYALKFSPVYAYSGLIDARPATAATIVVALLAALPAAWLPIAARRPSTIAMWTLYLLGYVPAVIVPLRLEGDLKAVLPFEAALVRSMALLILIVRVRPPLVRVPHLTLTDFTRLLTALGLLSSLYVAAAFGVHSLPGLADVYTTRAQFNTAQAGAIGSGYIVPWAANVINPMLMALGVARRRGGLVGLAALGQLLIYADTGYKSVLFSVALVPLVYLAVSRANRAFGLLATLATPAVMVGAVVASSVTGHWSLTLATRVFATPGHVGWYYYDYFSTHSLYHLSHSFLRWLGPSAYDVDPPQLIGAVYFHHSGTDANANLWGDAFANFGFAGMIVFTVICGIALLVADALGRGRDPRVAGPMLGIVGLSLGSSGLFTTILTQGLALGCILMALMPPVRNHVAASAQGSTG